MLLADGCATILIADPDAAERERIARILGNAGHAVHVADDADATIERLASSPIDLVVIDRALPGGGLATLARCKADHPSVLMAMGSSVADPETIVAAFRSGACDWIAKPFDATALLALAARAADLRRRGEARRRLADALDDERRRSAALRHRLESDDPFRTIVGSSPPVRKLIETAREVARTDSTVLLLGESGTGKGLVARAIHEASSRRERPFVEANCVVYSEGLLHSELFGHERGSFTGATRQKRGRFELARGGTLFLDEIGDIAQGLQLMLLRVLQERTFERVGGEETLEADVRLIAATNRDLGRAVASGTFRADLFYRLHVIPVALPPLRDRLDDVPLLAQHLLDRCSLRLERRFDGFDPDVLEILSRQDWPGNVRELENVVERCVVLSRGPWIRVEDLPESLRPAARPSSPASSGRLADLERERIEAALVEAGGNKKQAAVRLGIHRSTLYAKMRRHGLDAVGAARHGMSETATRPVSR